MFEDEELLGIRTIITICIILNILHVTMRQLISSSACFIPMLNSVVIDFIPVPPSPD